MTQFRYVAAAPSAAPVEGLMEAADKAAVVARLHASDLVPIRIEEAGRLAPSTDLAQLFRARHLSRRALALLTGQFATLLHAGLALDETLRLLTELAETPLERDALRALLEKVSGGASLAEAMAAQPRNFPDFYVSMIRAGEAGASLEAVLARLGEFLERSEAVKEHVRSALTYPLVVAATCLLSIGILFAFVVPRFRPLFEQAGDQLPASAQLLLAASDLVQGYWWLALALPPLLVLLLRQQWRNPARRQAWERLVMKLPLIGEVIAKVEAARFGRTLGTLLKNGVALLNALAITRETMGNQVFRQAIEGVAHRVRTGKGLAEPLSHAQVFPALAVHLVRVGEESGRLDEMLLKVAEIFEGETRRSLDRVLALLGPALTIGLGFVVAGVIGSILTAILGVYDLAM